MRQAIIWTNADPIHWRIYAALGGDELTRKSLNISCEMGCVWMPRNSVDD